MKKSTVRIISLILVILLVLGLFSSAIAMLAYSAATGGTTQYTQTTIPADTTVSRSLTIGKAAESVTVKFKFVSEDDLSNTYDFTDFSMESGSSFIWSTKSTLEIEESSKGNYYEATLKYVTYTGAGKSLALTLFGAGEDYYFYVPIPDKYFKESTGDDEDTSISSKIYWQSTVVRDSAGKKLAYVDKKSGQFTVEVVFYDIGLKDETNQSIDAAKKYAFITTTEGFKLHKGSLGTVERISSTNEYPRFRATFEGVQSMGTANTLSFNVIYDFPDYGKSVISEAVNAKLFQIDAESEEDEDEEIAPLIPNVIVQEYSYGNEAIVAGNEFNLDVVFANTSKTVAVENVVMTVEPANGFLIAAASNTMYFPNLNAGESKPYSVGLRALPSQNTTGTNSTATDYSLTIKFSYQYLSKKEYGKYETSTRIAIPVEQLDRFSVDEITDYTSYVMVGSEGYITIPITNKGKSATMNITGTVKSDSGADFVAPPTYFGSLAANESGTMNINITINTPGEFRGEAVVSYEDENMNQKEISVPFAIMVEQMMTPPPEIPMNPEMEQQQNKISPFSIALIVIGVLMLASPMAMILMKRIKARGNEDIDEDF